MHCQSRSVITRLPFACLPQGAGTWSDTLAVYAFEDGACANEPDATIWNANLAQFSEAMGSCCGGCLGIRGCFINCWLELFGYSQECSECWGSTCQCSSQFCLIVCLGPDQAACDQCVIDNCNPQTQACTGVPRDFIPRG